MQDRYGFTLLEVLIALFIISITAAVTSYAVHTVTIYQDRQHLYKIQTALNHWVTLAQHKDVNLSLQLSDDLVLFLLPSWDERQKNWQWMIVGRLKLPDGWSMHIDSAISTVLVSQSKLSSKIAVCKHQDCFGYFDLTALHHVVFNEY